MIGQRLTTHGSPTASHCCSGHLDARHSRLSTSTLQSTARACWARLVLVVVRLERRAQARRERGADRARERLDAHRRPDIQVAHGALGAAHAGLLEQDALPLGRAQLHRMFNFT
jgi:hypothetical protein